MGYTGYTNDSQSQGGDLKAQIAAGSPAAPPGGQPSAPGGYATQEQGQIDPQLQAILNLFNSTITGPTQAIANQQIGNIYDQMQLTTAGGDLQSQLAQQSAGFSMQGLGLQQQGLDVQGGALDRMSALLPKEFALQNQGFDLQQAQDIYGAGMQRRGLDSASTARGAYTAEGTNQGRSDIQQNLDYALQGLGIQRQQASLSNDEQMAQLADSKKMLGISSQQLGLSGQEIQARLQNALDQIGIGTQMTTDQLLSEVYKIQQGEISPISGIIGDIYALSGIPLPQIPSGSSAAASEGPNSAMKGPQ